MDLTNDSGSGQRQPVMVEVRDEYRIWLRYSDGVEGEVDLSDLVGRGVFEAWWEPGFFEGVHISERRTIAWNEDIEVCADAMYLEITGRVSRFYGIAVRVNYREGDTPRFHARYAGAEATIDTRRLALLNGELAGRARDFVMEWATLHQQELLDAWDRARRGESPGEIAPLDATDGYGDESGASPRGRQVPQTRDAARLRNANCCPPSAVRSSVGSGRPDRTESSEFDPLRPVAVEPRDGYRIWLRYADGVEGEVDLSHLAGMGVFVDWLDRAFFEGVHIGAGRAIAWSREIDLCPDALYLRLTGKPPEDIMPGLRSATDRA